MTITSKDNETIKHIRKLKEKKYRDEYGEYIVEGIKLINEAIEEEANIKTIIVCDNCDKIEKINQSSMYEVAKHNSVTNFRFPFLYVWMSLPGRYSDVWMLRAKSNFLPFIDKSGSASDCASHPRPVITIGPIKAPAL